MNKKSKSAAIKRSGFGDEFVWGVSTSALQTEGASHADGKGPSIWDEFAKGKKNILNNDSPEIACDFYTKYKEDIALVKMLGIPNFRFSLSWSRILPDGIGTINKKGIEFYHKVIDTCIESGIEPWITLYHWDLPETLQQKGGWTNREIINWFEHYVEVCIKEFKSKVKNWMVLNEPMVFTGAGYFLGVHAPGKKGIGSFLSAMHHAVLCQAIGLRTIKKMQPDAIVGTTYSCSFITPQSDSERDKQAAKRIDALLNRSFIEPSLGLGYPMETLPFLKKVEKYIKPGDEELMRAEFDFIGIQNYTREVVAYNFFIPFLKAKLIPADKRKVFHTQMDWEVYPEAIYQMVKKFSKYKGVKKIFITENGASFPDEIIDGIITDTARENFLKSYLEQVLKAKQEELKIKGYFVWSLTDNFEWAEGYHQRFGLIHIDFNTQQRTIKKSGYWYKDFLAG
ncbi:MAG: GH1 family beta-glucosidase [Bacteroidota bacterium]|nr:GH1 family beta-glucosidase [Bacteroidota bacterium]